ncbi:MAG: outer membrane lipoprotein-sorting protein [Gammaproteobacteria bacterium]|nr:outer membrane lipoprotein-sorting protein [Gammaproteobacteria bacterium]
MQRLRLLPLAALFAAPLPAQTPAETPEEQGLAIAAEADRRDIGWQDSKAAMKMVLRNRQGEVSERAIRVNSLEVKGDGDKSLIIFDQPADVKGTAFLSYTHATEPDDQWLYLPALKRIKRIASANKSGPFMGSEFAYEDISSQEVEKYSYKYLRDEEVDGLPAFVIERTPQYRHSGYTKQIAWLDKEHYRVLKVDYFDRKGAHIKTLTMTDYRQYLDRFWRANRMDMINHQNGKSTTLEWDNYQFRNGYTDRDFDRNTLKRAR